VPVVVHEQNALPGLANRIGARLAARVAVTVPGTPLHRGEHVGMPLRTAISSLDRAALRVEARAEFDLDADRPTLLVFGGSQGAASLNRAAVAASDGLTAAGVQVLHARGPKNTDVTVPARPTGSAPYVMVDYLERMDLAYAAADLALCRAGAVTVAELSAVGLPAAFVPLPIGNGEQRRNALPVVEAGGGLLVEDADLGADWIQHRLVPLLTDPDALSGYARHAAAAGVPDADERLADLVLDVARAGGRRT
jgi:UDP-N-acetylglucosamine--N-acetylmuramyl-(pentapeptide) pyrophosphoryl-undecaprenol N-acetylglucosamine transferase